MNVGQRAVVERMKRSNQTFTGNLAFFNNWELFWSSGRTVAALVAVIVPTKTWLINLNRRSGATYIHWPFRRHPRLIHHRRSPPHEILASSEPHHLGLSRYSHDLMGKRLQPRYRDSQALRRRILWPRLQHYKHSYHRSHFRALLPRCKHPNTRPNMPSQQARRKRRPTKRIPSRQRIPRHLHAAHP
jgi:hypothetical protein